MPNKVDHPHTALAAIAGRQHGVVTAKQLAALGISRAAISERVKSGRLHRLHRGIYAVGHRSPNEWQRYMAAVLACGRGAVLSHQSAAYLWGFLKPEGGPVHVTSPSRSGKLQRAGIRLHRSPSLEREGEATRRERIPVTSPRRTILDLEGTIEPYLARKAKGQAEFLKFRLNLPTDRTRSGLERDFLRFLAKHGFFDYHRGSVAFEDDHERELHLRRAGYVVRRFTGAQIRNHPALVVEDLGEVLERR